MGEVVTTMHPVALLTIGEAPTCQPGTRAHRRARWEPQDPHCTDWSTEARRHQRAARAGTRLQTSGLRSPHSKQPVSTARERWEA